MSAKSVNIRSTLEEMLAQRLWEMRDEKGDVPGWLLRVIDDDLTSRMVIVRGSLRIALSLAKDKPVAAVDHIRGVRYDNVPYRSGPTKARSSLFVEQSIRYFSNWTRKRTYEDYWSLTSTERSQLLRDLPVTGGYRLWDGVDSAPLITKQSISTVRDNRIDPIIHHPMFEQQPPPIFGSY